MNIGTFPLLKRFLLVILLVLFAVAIARIQEKSSSKTEKPTKKDQISIITTFYPLAEFAQAVGKERVYVTNLTPAGAEPHDYEASPQDLKKLREARLFLFNGSGLDSWADKLIENIDQKKVKTIDVSHYIDLIDADPHFWLDPEKAQQEVKTITEALIQIDPAYKTEYMKNSQEYIGKLQKLDQTYRDELQSCRIKEIVVSHNAFRYLARRYNLTVLYISGISPEDEPSPKRIAEIATIAKKKKIQYIFFETLVDPLLAKTVASEIGAQTLVLNPIEGLTKTEIQKGKNYLTVMEENLTNLKKALDCR